MGINLIRIDDRLIHGQIVEGWMRVVKTEKILIISDELFNKEEEKVLFSLALPFGIEVEYVSVDEAIEIMKKDSFDGKQVMILTESPGPILFLLEGGVKIGSVNVGGMHFAKGKLPINDSLYVDGNDCDVFEKIAGFGVVIEGRALPNDKRLDVMEEIRKIRKLKNI